MTSSLAANSLETNSLETNSLDSHDAHSAQASGSAELLQQRLNDPRVADGLNRLLDRADSIAFAIEAFEGFVARSETIINSVSTTVAELKSAQHPGNGQLTGLLEQAPTLLDTGAKLASVSQQANLGELEKSQIVERLTKAETLATLNQLLDKLPLMAMLVEAMDGFIRRGDTIAENVAGIVRELNLAENTVDLQKLSTLIQTLPKLQEMGDHLLNSSLASDDLPKVVDAGVSMINSGMLDKEVVATLGQLGRDAVHTYVAVKASQPAPLGGLWAMLRAAKDPEVQQSMGFMFAFAKAFAKHLK